MEQNPPEYRGDEFDDQFDDDAPPLAPSPPNSRETEERRVREDALKRIEQLTDADLPVPPMHPHERDHKLVDTNGASGESYPTRHQPGSLRKRVTEYVMDGILDADAICELIEDDTGRKPHKATVQTYVRHVRSPSERERRGRVNANLARAAARRDAFLVHLARTGSIMKSGQAVGIAASQVHSRVLSWRQRFEEFSASCDAALEIAREDLVAEARRRAVDGWDEPVYQNGAQVGVVRKHSDRLLEVLLRAMDKRFQKQEKLEVEHQVKGVLRVPTTIDNVDDWQQMAIEDEKARAERAKNVTPD